MRWKIWAKKNVKLIQIFHLVTLNLFNHYFVAMASLHLDKDHFALSFFQDISLKTIDIKYQSIKSKMP